MKVKAKKDEILLAASRIIHSKNLTSMTLDKIAKESKISKGGLLYHFPNKNSIVQGLIEMGIQNYYETIEEYQKNDLSDSGKWSRAYMTGSFFEPKETKELWISGLLSALAFNRESLDFFSENFKMWQNRSENDGIDPINATIIKLVADGVWFLELFGFTHMTEKMKKDIYEKLLALSHEEL